jgi:exopolysaccharide biosynthesis polyprenyl glycosylphosphotransferase
MTSPRSLYRFFQLLCDLAALVIAWYTTVLSRVLLTPHPGVSITNSNIWAPPLSWILAVWIAAAVLLHLYQAPIRKSIGTSIRRAAQAAVTVLMVTISVLYFCPNLTQDTSRHFMLMFSPASFMLLVASRFTAHRLAIRMARNLPGRDRSAILSDEPEASRMMAKLAAHPDIPPVCGVIVPENGRKVERGGPVIGTTGSLAAVINHYGIGHLILTNSGVETGNVDWCLDVCRRMEVSVSLVLSRPESPDLPPDLIELPTGQITPWQQTAKRALDIILATLALVVLSPVLILIAIAVKATSKGPLLYCAPRVGKGGRYFTFLKFRSMYTDRNRTTVAGLNEKEGHIFKMRCDPRVTPIGRLMRRMSLDELPQLINVLHGDMSLVGPRPLPAEDLGPDGMSARFVIWSRLRSRTRPGITGLWQIRGRSNLPFDAMVRYDQEYINDWSLVRDLVILAKTPLLVLRGDGAY